MSKTPAMKLGLCIEYRETEARLVLASRRGGELVVAWDEIVRWKPTDDARQRGEQIAALLTSHRANKTPSVVALAREQLAWQTYQLPPAPAADLADLVHLQAARDLSTDDQATLDFLPLEGDDVHPYRVLTVADRRGRLAQIRNICTAAGIEPVAVAPLELGWPGVVETELDGSDVIGVAITQEQAVVWVIRDGQLQRLRTCRLPSGATQTAAKVLAGELRRTALAEQLAGDREARWMLLVDKATEPIAGEVVPTLPGRVEVRLLSTVAANGDSGVVVTADNAAHAALAADLADGKKTSIDLLHPRQRPEPPSRIRTYVLAAAAVAAAAIAVGWQGYENLRAPLLAAETAQQEITEMAPMVETMAIDVARRDQVAQWQAATPNLLDQMTLFSRQLRPAPLGSDDFAAEDDAMLTRLAQTGNTMTLTAAIRNANAAGLIERRLREANRRVVRQRLEGIDDGPPGYQQQLVIAVEEAPSAGSRSDAIEEAP